MQGPLDQNLLVLGEPPPVVRRGDAQLLDLRQSMVAFTPEYLNPESSPNHRKWEWKLDVPSWCWVRVGADPDFSIDLPWERNLPGGLPVRLLRASDLFRSQRVIRYNSPACTCIPTGKSPGEPNQKRNLCERCTFCSLVEVMIDDEWVPLKSAGFSAETTEEVALAILSDADSGLPHYFQARARGLPFCPSGD
jgi:hypothetical protein